MEDNKIISALIGLVGACNNNPKTENTDRVVIKALAFSLTHPEADIETLHALIEEIHTEKYAIAPSCAVCQTPCGNTSDYDMNRIYNAETDVRDLKLKMLSALKELAADLYSYQKLNVLSAEDMEIFYRVLAYISFDMEKNSLLAFWDEVHMTIEKIKGKTTVTVLATVCLNAPRVPSLLKSGKLLPTMRLQFSLQSRVNNPCYIGKQGPSKLTAIFLFPNWLSGPAKSSLSR